VGTHAWQPHGYRRPRGRRKTAGVRAGTVRDILTHLAKGASTFSCGRGVSYCNEKPACKL